MKSKFIKGLITGALVLMTCTVNANLIRNASFEDVPNSNTGQAKMPSEWVASHVTPDAYSNDNSYGIGPSNPYFSNFGNITAYDGIRWVAAWSSAGQERFGQTLTDRLIAGTEYDFSGFLHQAFRSDLNHQGGYEVFLTSTYYSAPTTGEYLGYLGETNGFSEGWQQYSFSFTATAEMASLDFLMFAPIQFNASGGVYPGLDLVSLKAASSPGGGAIPEPASILLLGVGLFAMAFRHKKNM